MGLGEVQGQTQQHRWQQLIQQQRQQQILQQQRLQQAQQIHQQRQASNQQRQQQAQIIRAQQQSTAQQTVPPKPDYIKPLTGMTPELLATFLLREKDVETLTRCFINFKACKSPNSINLICK